MQQLLAHTNTEIHTKWSCVPSKLFTKLKWVFKHEQTRTCLLQATINTSLPVLFFICSSLLLFSSLFPAHYLCSFLVPSVFNPKCSWTVVLAYPPPAGPPCRNNERICSNIVLLRVQVCRRFKQRKNKYIRRRGWNGEVTGRETVRATRWLHACVKNWAARLWVQTTSITSLSA